MDWNHRIEMLKQWGAVIKQKDWSSVYDDIQRSNPWFTVQSIELGLSGVCRYLDPPKLDQWSESYHLKTSNSRTVGLILAGNIPLVGIHDFICLVAAGHGAKIKMSSQDLLLLPLLYQELVNIEPLMEGLFTFTDMVPVDEIDAIVATGSDNTSRYIKYYYQGVPQIVRSNRTSIAVIRGDESSCQLSKLGTDIFSYFGKGCRNISKVWVPPNYDFTKFISSNQRFVELLKHSKYQSNYSYQRALFSTQGKKFIDTGYSFFYQSKEIVSPLSVVFFDSYNNPDQLNEMMLLDGEKIQCIASANGWYDLSYPFGSLQKPDIWDYADNIDTMEFLLEL
jgi:hypothetical protein